MFNYKEIAIPFDSVAVDLHEVQTIFQAIDHYLVAQESHGPDTPELESTDLGTEFADFAVPLRNHYAQLHADQVAYVAALREACLMFNVWPVRPGITLAVTGRLRCRRVCPAVVAAKALAGCGDLPC